MHRVHSNFHDMGVILQEYYKISRRKEVQALSKLFMIIDKDTGEILEEYDSSEVRIIGKKQIDSCKSTNGGSIKKEEEESRKEGISMRNTFIKNNHLELRAVKEELDLYERSVLTSMMDYIEYWSNCVVINEEGFTTVDDIARISKVSWRKALDVLKSLTEKRLIAKVISGKRNRYQYYINPWIATRGNVVNATLKSMFGEYPVRTKGMIKWKDL